MSRLPNSEPFGSRLKTYLIEGGGRTWARTKDPLIKSQLLYQLSYASIPIVSETRDLGGRSRVPIRVRRCI